MRAVMLPSWVVTIFLTVLFAAGLEVTGKVQYAPFALSLIFLGLPHGAVDHLVPGRLSKGGVSVQSVAAVALLYAVLATIYLAFWALEPVAAFVFFILLTWFHWGQGDLYSSVAFLRTLNTAPLALKALSVLMRGGLPMLVPLLAFPEVYREVAGSIIGLFADRQVTYWIFTPSFRIVAGLTFLIVILVTLAWEYYLSRPQNRIPWVLEAGEVGFLALYFAIVPPVFAIGMYFCVWHAPRHIARLMLLSRSSSAALQKGNFLPALKDFSRDAAPLTAVALLLLAALYFFVPGNVEGAAGLLAVYLVLISVLTLPHVVIVGLMDRRQGMWR